MKTLLIGSGGLDSAVLAYKIREERTLSGFISFAYGQRHKKELGFAKACAERLGIPFDLLDISAVGGLLSGSALTDDVAVPDGHYAEESMKITVVPNRNTIMLAIASGLAAARGLDSVAAAMHGGDHFIYPDCRPGFIEAFQTMQDKAMDGLADIRLYTPFLSMTKAEIVAEGARRGVPFAETWSCYKGGDVHCGRCGTCVERQEAFHLAGVHDPTPYEDTQFWRETTRRKVF